MQNTQISILLWKILVCIQKRPPHFGGHGQQHKEHVLTALPEGVEPGVRPPKTWRCGQEHRSWKFAEYCSGRF